MRDMGSLFEITYYYFYLLRLVCFLIYIITVNYVTLTVYRYIPLATAISRAYLVPRLTLQTTCYHDMCAVGGFGFGFRNLSVSGLALWLCLWRLGKPHAHHYLHVLGSQL